MLAAHRRYRWHAQPTVLALFLAVAILYGMTLSVAAVLLEEISFRRYPAWTDLVKLFTFALIENLGYRQMLSVFKMRAFGDAPLDVHPAPSSAALARCC